MEKHGEITKRQIQVVNLDPAAEQFEYQLLADIRELISVDDVMQDDEMKLGPNGSLVFCMEYLANHFDWLEEQLGEAEDDYIIFDCPGQIELYTHLTVIRQLVENLQKWDFTVCGVFLLDSHFLVDSSKFFSGILVALSAMVGLEIPHVNVISKMDLVGKQARKKIHMYLDPNTNLLQDIHDGDNPNNKYVQLSQSIGKLIEDFSLVRFVPLDIKNEDSVTYLMYSIDNAMNYGEDQDVKTRDFEDT